MGPRLCECCKQGQADAEVMSNSRKKFLKPRARLLASSVSRYSQSIFPFVSYESSDHTKISQKGLNLQVTVNPKRWNRRKMTLPHFAQRDLWKRRGKIGEKQKMKKGQVQVHFQDRNSCSDVWVLQTVPKIVPLFEFPSFAAAWQSEKPVHSQSAKMKNFLPEFTQITSLSFVQPCSSMKVKPL